MKFLALKICVVFSLAFVSGLSAQTIRYFCENGEVSFISEAPLEIIESSSKNLKGIIDTSTRQFAFTIDIMSFTGFNSPLQHEHFRENYMEISRFGTATFEGKLIEQINPAEAGIFDIRAKGKIAIHGHKQEIIIPCQLISDGTTITASSEFVIRLVDYNIAIPKVVISKIAEEITVKVSAVFQKK